MGDMFIQNERRPSLKNAHGNTVRRISVPTARGRNQRGRARFWDRLYDEAVQSSLDAPETDLSASPAIIGSVESEPPESWP